MSRLHVNNPNTFPGHAVGTATSRFSRERAAPADPASTPGVTFHEPDNGLSETVGRYEHVVVHLPGAATMSAVVPIALPGRDVQRFRSRSRCTRNEPPPSSHPCRRFASMSARNASRGQLFC